MSCCGGKCGCGSACKCGSGCNGCGMYPDVEANAGASTMIFAATHKGSAGGMEMATEGAENGGCGCSTCKCGTTCSGCSCCSCN